MGKVSSLIRLLLLISGALFFAVQFRMFFSHIQCSEKVRELRLENEKLFQKLSALRFNLTSLYSEKNFIRSQLVSSEDNLKIIRKSYESKVKSLEASIKVNEENEKKLNQKIAQLDFNLQEQFRIQNDLKNRIHQQAQNQANNHDFQSFGNGIAQKTENIKDSTTTTISTDSIANSTSLKSDSTLQTDPKSVHALEVKQKRIQQQIKDMENYKNYISVIYSPKSIIAAVVIMACNRHEYLQRTIKSVLKHHNSPSKFPLFISQDGTNEDVKRVARSFPQFIYMQHVEDSPPKPKNPNENIAYYRIANHYKWALTQLFDIQKFSRVIILEDDMELSVDFFDYFEATSFLLDVDESLLAVSSWNDNGQFQFVKDSEAVYRSDFFPGLGWMLRKELWNELRPKWPAAYWDDWLRLEVNRKGRNTIYPEVCRTYNFGEHGSSYGQFFQKYLEPIKLNDVKVSWLKKDLNFLLEPFYSQKLRDEIDSAKILSLRDNNADILNLSQNSVLIYENQMDFSHTASFFGIFEEWKDGIPRTSFKMVVFFRFKGPHKIYLVHKSTANLLKLNRPLNNINS